MRERHFLILLGIVLTAFTVSAYNDPENQEEPEVTTLTAEEERMEELKDSIESKEMREGEVEIENEQQQNRGAYPFFKTERNHILLNGDDWNELRQRYANAGEDQFTIVHIGDSHLQADIATSYIRKELQKAVGSAGRGLIIPFRLAGTNEPVDYRFTIDSRLSSSRLLKMPWNTPMSMTGIGIQPESKTFKLKIEQLDELEEPFRFIRLYVTGAGLSVEQAVYNMGWIPFTIDDQRTEGYYDIFLDREVPWIELTLHSDDFPTLGGTMLSAEKPGLFYHTIGNNGATYASYNQIDNIGEQISTLYPDLIIISLGTNEAFGRLDATDFYNSVHRLLGEIQRSNPEAKVLLTTPKECRRRASRRARRRGAKAYTVVENCRNVRNILLDYCREHRIPVYDWYEVAGGDGASSQWIDSSLLGRDGVHDTATGYNMAGKLMATALKSALEME